MDLHKTNRIRTREIETFICGSAKPRQTQRSEWKITASRKTQHFCSICINWTFENQNTKNPLRTVTLVVLRQKKMLCLCNKNLCEVWIDSRKNCMILRIWMQNVEVFMNNNTTLIPLACVKLAGMIHPKAMLFLFNNMKSCEFWISNCRNHINLHPALHKKRTLPVEMPLNLYGFWG